MKISKRLSVVTLLLISATFLFSSKVVGWQRALGPPVSRKTVRSDAQPSKRTSKSRSVNWFNSDPSTDTLRPVPKYIGTVIAVSENLAANTRLLEEEFAKTFAKHDPEPPSRAEHFQWIPQIDGMSRIGWYGGVTEIKSVNDGWIISIEIKPYLYSATSRTFVPDWVTERYFFDGEILNFLESDAAIPKPNSQIMNPAQ